MKRKSKFKTVKNGKKVVLVGLEKTKSRNTLHRDVQLKGGASSVHKSKKSYDRGRYKNPKNW